MNSKLEKYTGERDKIIAKIAALDARRKALDGKIMEIENLEIRALMRSEKLSLSELMELVRSLQDQQRTAAAYTADNEGAAREMYAPSYDNDENDEDDESYEEETDDEEI